MIKECMDDGPEIPEQIVEVRKALWSFQEAGFLLSKKKSEIGTLQIFDLISKGCL